MCSFGFCFITDASGAEGGVRSYDMAPHKSLSFWRIDDFVFSGNHLGYLPKTFDEFDCWFQQWNGLKLQLTIFRSGGTLALAFTVLAAQVSIYPFIKLDKAKTSKNKKDQRWQELEIFNEFLFNFCKRSIPSGKTCISRSCYFPIFFYS